MNNQCLRRFESIDSSCVCVYTSFIFILSFFPSLSLQLYDAWLGDFLLVRTAVDLSRSGWSRGGLCLWTLLLQGAVRTE